jgi:hypothetical protein
MLETGIIGGILGGLFRLAPEVLKFFKSKSEMQHELEMFRLQTELEKTRGEMKIESEYVQFSTAGIEAVVEANKAEAELAKNNYRWINAFISLQRPYITFTIFTLYVAVKITMITQGFYDGIPLLELLRETWTENDVGILMMILNYHFVGRSIEKYRR